MKKEWVNERMCFGNGRETPSQTNLCMRAMKYINKRNIGTQM